MQPSRNWSRPAPCPPSGPTIPEPAAHTIGKAAQAQRDGGAAVPVDACPYARERGQQESGGGGDDAGQAVHVMAYRIGAPQDGSQEGEQHAHAYQADAPQHAVVPQASVRGRPRRPRRRRHRRRRPAAGTARRAADAASRRRRPAGRRASGSCPATLPSVAEEVVAGRRVRGLGLAGSAGGSPDRRRRPRWSSGSATSITAVGRDHGHPAETGPHARSHFFPLSAARIRARPAVAHDPSPLATLVGSRIVRCGRRRRQGGGGTEISLPQRGIGAAVSQIVVKRPPRACPPDVPTDELCLEAPPELPAWPAGGRADAAPADARHGLVGGVLLHAGHARLHAHHGCADARLDARHGDRADRAATAGAPRERWRRSRRDYLKYLAQTRAPDRAVRRLAARRPALSPSRSRPAVVGGRRGQPGVGAAGRRRRLRAGPDRAGRPAARHPAGRAGHRAGRRAGAADRGCDAAASSPPTARCDDMPVAVSHARLLPRDRLRRAGGRPRRRRGRWSPSSSRCTRREDLMVAVVAAPGAAARVGMDQVAAARPAARARSTARAPGGCSATTWPNWKPCCGDQLDGRPRFSRDAPPLLDQPHLVIVLDGGIVRPDSGVRGARRTPGRHRRSRWCRANSTSRAAGCRYWSTPAGSVWNRRRLASTTARRTRSPSSAPRRWPGSWPRCGSAGRRRRTAARQPRLHRSARASATPGSVDVARTWRPRSQAERLRVPIGVGEDGQPVMLDLKEAAQDGMGPHGLCVGATGSGKSELLRTLVLGLAVTHSSETLNFVLADFKGGATFAGMSALPARRGRHHQPGGRPHPRRPHGRLHPRRAPAPPGTAALGGQLRQHPRLREGPRRRRAAGAARLARHRDRRVQRTAHREARLHRDVHPDRPHRPFAGRAPAAGLAAPGGGPAARPGHLPLVPHRPAHLLRRRVARRARRPGRLSPAVGARLRLPQVRHGRDDPLQGRLRLRGVPRGRPRRSDEGRSPSSGAPRSSPAPPVPVPTRAGPGRRPEPGTRPRRGRRPRRHRAGRDRRPAGGPGPARPPGLAAAAGQGPRPGRAAAAAGGHARAAACTPRTTRGHGRARWSPSAWSTSPSSSAAKSCVPRLLRRRRPHAGRRRPAVRQVHAAAHPDRRRSRSPTPRPKCSSTGSTSAAAA